MSNLTEKFTSFVQRRKIESSDSDSWSSSDNESTSSLFSRFEPQFSSKLFQATSVHSQSVISQRPSRKRRRSSLTLISERKKRKRVLKLQKDWLPTAQLLNSKQIKNQSQVGCLADLVPFFQRQFQKILPSKFRTISEFITCVLRFQSYILSFCTPLQRDEFYAFCFQIDKMGSKTIKKHDDVTVVNFGSDNRVPLYVVKQSLSAGKWQPFQSLSTSFLKGFFTLSSTQSYVL